MSRHRNIRNLDIDDEFGSDDDADYYGRSYEDEVALSPNSARFIYSRRDGGNPFFQGHREEAIVEERYDETQHNNYHEDAFQFDEEKGKVNEVNKPSSSSTKESMIPVVSQSLAKFSLGTSGEGESSRGKPLQNVAGPIISPVVQQLRVSDIPKVRATSKSPTRAPVSVNDGLRQNLSTQSLSALLTSTPFKKRKRPEGDKEKLNLVIVGHVDAGKSTLMGHVLLQLGFVDQRVINKYKHEASKLGKGSFAFAWVLDETEEERERGVTMDIARTYFETDNKKVVLLDAPGHKDFIPNMITGAAQADAALIVVNATRGEFETGFDQGGQTREHIMLLRSFGVSKVAVAVNKMDTIQWSQERYEEIVAKMKQFLLKQAGISKFSFVPLSGLEGINLTKRPGADVALTKWYNGPTLIEVIDEMPSGAHSVDDPLRAVISDVVKANDNSIQVCAKIEAGHLEANDRVVLLPGIVPAIVKSACCENSGATNEICFAGDQCLITMSGHFESDSITAGNVIARGGDGCLQPAKRFLARIVTFDLSIPFLRGTRAELYAHSMCTPATITKMNAILHKSTGEVTKGKPRAIPGHTSALIELTTQYPVALEPYKSCKPLGRITLRDKGETVAAGIIEKVIK